MANTNPITKDTVNNVWPYEIEISASGWTQTHTFSTANKFLDANIAVKAHANAAGAVTLSLTDKSSTELGMGSVSSGYYYPTIALSGNVNVASAGWITAGNKEVTDNSVVVGKVAQSLLKQGSSTVASGTVINPTASQQTIDITAGYNAARSIKIGPISDGPSAVVQSGTASLGALTYTYDSSAVKFNISGTATIAEPDASTAGYISNSVGTRSGNSNTVTQTVDVVTVGSETTGTFTKAKPSIVRTAKSGGTWIDASSGSEVSSPTSGQVYVQVDAAAASATLVTRGKVTAAGYGTTSNFKRTSTNLSTDVGSQAADTKYIPIKTASITQPSIGASISDPAYQSSGTYSGQFTVTVNETISAPTVSSDGYVHSGNIATATTTGSVTGTKALGKVKVGVTLGSSNIKVTPVITRQAKPESGAKGWTDAASGSATTTEPESGAYVKVYTPAVAASTTATGKVSTAGYGTTSQYATDANSTVTGGSNAATSAYIPITAAASFTNSIGTVTSSGLAIGSESDGYYPITANLSIPATITAGTDGWFHSATATGTKSSVSIGSIAKATFTVNGGAVTVNTAGYIPANFSVTTLDTATFGNDVASGKVQSDYTDISSSANTPVLVSGKGLYINAGYVGNTYISLAKLVPDSATMPTGATSYSAGLRTGFALYDEHGALVTGSIDTYDGAYTIA